MDAGIGLLPAFHSAYSEKEIKEFHSKIYVYRLKDSTKGVLSQLKPQNVRQGCVHRLKGGRKELCHKVSKFEARMCA